jgi:hypothetical protein
MDEVKRKINFNQSFEDLSNELFYEIFDYLDGCELFLAFSNLNHRFHRLLCSSSFLFKLRFCKTKDEQLINKYKQMIIDHKHQTISFNLCLSSHNDYFFSSFSIDSSFDHLESLSLTGINPSILPSCLIKLGYVPRLYSLTIDTWNGFDDLKEIYRLIFALPVLKSYKLIIFGDDNDSFTTLPMAIENELSTIKYLDMVHSCVFNEVAHIVSYTPELRRLKFIYKDDFYPDIGITLPIILPNLTYLSICANQSYFNEFEIFIKRMHHILKVLHFTTRTEDITYLDAAKWEQLISQDLPRLKEFKFEYHKYTYETELMISDDEFYQFLYHENESMISDDESYQFTSAFWFERQWIYEVKIDDEQTIYSISPYKYIENKLLNSKINLSLLEKDGMNICNQKLIILLFNFLNLLI